MASPSPNHRRMGILKNRQFATFLSGQFVSRMGNSVHQLALLWLAHVLTNSTFDMSLVLIAQVVPRIVISPISGVLTDRWFKKRTMLFGDLARFVLVSILAALVLQNQVNIVVLIIASFVLSTIGTFVTTSYRAFQVQLLSNDELVRGNAAMEGATNLSAIVGPALGGLLIGLCGISTAFVFDAASFLVSATALLIIRVAETKPETRRLTGLSIVKDIQQGAKITFSFSEMRTLLPLMLVYNFLVLAIENILLIQYVANVLHLGASAVGLVNTAMAIGELLGNILLTFVQKKFKQHRLLVTNMVITAFSLSVVGFSPWLWLICICFFISGICMSIVNVTYFSAIQSSVPANAIGAVFGLLGFLFEGISPLAQLFYGSIALFLPTGDIITTSSLIAAATGLAFLFRKSPKSTVAVPAVPTVDPDM